MTWPVTRAAWESIAHDWRELRAARREQRIFAAIHKAMDLAEDYPATVLTLGSAMNVLEAEVGLKVDAANRTEKPPAGPSPAAPGASCAPPAPSPSSPAAHPSPVTQC